MKVYGGIWKYMEVCGRIWRYMEVYGGIWMYVEVYGGKWGVPGAVRCAGGGCGASVAAAAGELMPSELYHQVGMRTMFSWCRVASSTNVAWYNEVVCEFRQSFSTVSNLSSRVVSSKSA